MPQVTKDCVACGKHFSFDVPDREWEAWSAGGLAQVAMPSVSEDMRELMISGICGSCFDALFADEDTE